MSDLLEAKAQLDGKVNEYKSLKDWELYDNIDKEKIPWNNWWYGKVCADRSVIVDMQVFVSRNSGQMHVFIIFGNHSLGSPLHLHGGLSFALMDHYGGYNATINTKNFVMTANVNMQYKAPIYPNTLYIMKAKVVKMENKVCSMEIDIVDTDDKICTKGIFDYVIIDGAKLTAISSKLKPISSKL